MLRAFLGRSTHLIASRKVQITLPLLRLRLSQYSVDTIDNNTTNSKPKGNELVLKNVKELAAYLLSTARDDNHVESRLQAIRHSFIPSSENVSAAFTVVGNDQWFYSLLETVVATEKNKIFPVHIDRAVHPVILVDLVPELTTEIELLFTELHNRTGEDSDIIRCKCAQEAKGIADKLHPTNSLQQNMVEVLILVLQRSWKASVHPDTKELLKETFNETLTNELLAHPTLRYHINAIGQLFSLLNLPISPVLESEMQEQTKKRLDLCETITSELQELIKNHTVVEKAAEKAKSAAKSGAGRPKLRLKLQKKGDDNTPESDPLYITLFCNKISDSAAKSKSKSEVVESDSLSTQSVSSESLSPSKPTTARSSFLRAYTPLQSSSSFNPETVDTTHFTRSKGTIVVDNLPHGVVNSIVLNKFLGGIAIKSSKLYRNPITVTVEKDAAPKEKKRRKKGQLQLLPAIKMKKLSESTRTDNYAVLEVADAANFNALMHDSVRIFGIVIMGQSCNVYPADHLKRFIIELPEPVVVKDVLKVMRKILRGHFDIETMQGIPHHRRKDRNSAPVDNKERVLLCNFEFDSSNEAFEAFQLLAKKLKRSLKLSSPLLSPLWLSSNRPKEDRALHARLKNALDRLKAKQKADSASLLAAAVPVPIAATGVVSGTADRTAESSSTIIDSDITTTSTSSDSRDRTTISLIVN